MASYPLVKFVTSADKPGQFPADAGAEVSVAGRSNAGKSSAINAITQRKGLARTSKTPGATRLINFFELEPGRRLVDLPGYGFAAVSGEMRRHWGQLVSGYFERRKSLRGSIVVMTFAAPDENGATCWLAISRWCRCTSCSPRRQAGRGARGRRAGAPRRGETSASSSSALSGMA
jgi:ribosome biogenesis GTP-binding protein YsxC/EngB